MTGFNRLPFALLFQRPASIYVPYLLLFGLFCFFAVLVDCAESLLPNISSQNLAFTQQASLAPPRFFMYCQGEHPKGGRGGLISCTRTQPDPYLYCCCIGKTHTRESKICYSCRLHHPDTGVEQVLFCLLAPSKDFEKRNCESFM